jgi:hypothetical protein
MLEPHPRVSTEGAYRIALRMRLNYTSSESEEGT